MYALVRSRVDTRAVKAAIKEAQTGKAVTKKRAIELIFKYNTRTKSQAKPDVIHSLRSSIKKFVETIDQCVKVLQPDERATLSDQLLNLALRLRPVETTVSTNGGRKSRAGNGNGTTIDTAKRKGQTKHTRQRPAEPATA